MAGAPEHADPWSLVPVQAGEVVAGKYRIDRVLAVGGMGVVLEAHHLQLEERVAIKTLQPAALENHEAVERFAAEARAAARIKSEHVARVIDVGQLDVGGPYMVMEHLAGEDLSARLERGGPFAPSEAVDLILEAAEAIAEAHANGIVHRDLKPANLFLSSQPNGSTSLKVLDFGISKFDRRFKREHPETVEELTAIDAILGSPLYMAPEQMRAAREADARSDVWALGAILYEMLMGRSPFEAETEHEICRKIFNDEPAPIAVAHPAVALDLERAVRRALEKELAQRFQTVGDFANALLPHGSSAARLSVERIHGVLSRAGIASSSAAPAAQAAAASVHLPSTAAATQLVRRPTPAAWGDAPQGTPRRSPILWGLGIGAIGAALVTVYLANARMVEPRTVDAQPAARAAAATIAASPSAPSPVVTAAPSAAPAPPAPAATTAEPAATMTLPPVVSPPAEGRPSPPARAPAAPPRATARAAAVVPKPSATAAPKAPPNAAGLFDEQK
jgi:serine/threonine-protein kinase